MCMCVSVCLSPKAFWSILWMFHQFFLNAHWLNRCRPCTQIHFIYTEYVGLNLGQKPPEFYTCAWLAFYYDSLFRGETLSFSYCCVTNTLLVRESLVCKELSVHLHFCPCVLVANRRNLYFFLSLGQNILRDLSTMKDHVGLYCG